MSSGKLLVIEDEEKISRILQLELTHEDYDVHIENEGRSGLEAALRKKWDVIMLDIMLPELNGIEVLRRLRNVDKVTPVILLTARDTTPDKVNGLDQGANDYITKPFEIEEVLARIRSCMRMVKNTRERDEQISSLEPTELSMDSLVVKLLSHEVFRDGKKITLTPKEFDLLVFLLENRNRVLTRDQIIQQVWGYDFVGDTNLVDVYIRYLRRKIDYAFRKQLIQTVRGVGYCMRGDG